MLALSSVPVLFFLFYFLPGAILISSSSGAKEKRFENFALAILLSLVFAPLTFTLLSQAVPGNDRLLLAGYLLFWALALIGVRLFRPTVSGWLPDFSALPKTDRTAVLFSLLLTAIVVSLRFDIFQGISSPIGDDYFHLTKLTSIAATGLPSVYARQPLYPFTYYDLDYIAPALWVRYTGGAVGIALVWVVHIGIQTFAVSLFLTRLIYMYAATRMTRLFGLLALHTATGFDIFFLPWLQKLQLEGWPVDLNWFDGFVQILMPITHYICAPQRQMGLAVLGLIFYVITAGPFPEAGPFPQDGGRGLRTKGYLQAVAVALLLVALFRTDTFVFAAAAPGLGLWYFYELLTSKGRIRQLAHLATTALVALVLVFPYLHDILSKRSLLEFGLRSFVFLDIPGIPWLRYPITGFVFLALEIGIPVLLLLWFLAHPRLCTRSLRFWLFLTVGLLIPFIARAPNYIDIALRGVMPAQLATAMIACFVLTLWQHQKRRYVAALVAIQFVLSVVTVGVDTYFRFREETAAIPATSRWIARNTPPTALVFYEQDPITHAPWQRMLEVNYGQRLSYVPEPTSYDYNFAPVPPSAWLCLQDVNLYDANSLCSIEAHIPGTQPVYIKYLSAAPALDTVFTLVHESSNGSIFSLSCPNAATPEYPNPPTVVRETYQELRNLLSEIPADHAIAASTQEVEDWLRSEESGHRLFKVTPEDEGGAVNTLSQTGFWLTVMPENEGALLARQLGFYHQLLPIDVNSSPVWFVLDYLYIDQWNDMLLTHIQENYFVAFTQWLACKQLVVLALPSPDGLHVVGTDISFDGALEVSELRTSGPSHRAGEIVPIELTWRRLKDVQLKYFVHLVDEQGVLRAQIDLPAADDGTDQLQLTRMGLYLPPELPAGAYQIRLGVYRPEDGQRLTLPNGDDSAYLPLTVTP